MDRDRHQLTTVVVGDEPDGWATAGFTVHDDCIRIGSTTISIALCSMALSLASRRFERALLLELPPAGGELSRRESMRGGGSLCEAPLCEVPPCEAPLSLCEDIPASSAAFA